MRVSSFLVVLSLSLSWQIKENKRGAALYQCGIFHTGYCKRMKLNFTATGNIIYETSGIHCCRRSASQIPWRDNFTVISKFCRYASIDNSMRLIRFHASEHKIYFCETSKDFCLHLQHHIRLSEVFTSEASEVLWPPGKRRYKFWGSISSALVPSWVPSPSSGVHLSSWRRCPVTLDGA